MFPFVGVAPDEEPEPEEPEPEPEDPEPEDPEPEPEEPEPEPPLEVRAEYVSHPYYRARTK